MQIKNVGYYEDNYPSCDETRANLRIYYQDQLPDFITQTLGITPTKIQIKGQIAECEGKKVKKEYPLNGWFFSSENEIKSKDSRRHIDYILDKFMPVNDKIQILRDVGASIDLVCYWRTAQGHGGPIISPDQSEKLFKLKMPLWYDFYT